MNPSTAKSFSAMVWRTVEVAALALLFVCTALLFLIEAARFCIVYGITVLVFLCCIGGVVLWAAGG